MLLQTNSYIVPREKRDSHARLMRQFRQTMLRLGCDQFEVYEQVEANWAMGEHSDRFVQLMRFRDRHHQRAVQMVEKQDTVAQQLISEFCEMIDFPQQQEQGSFVVGYYQSVLPIAPARPTDGDEKGHGSPAEPKVAEEKKHPSPSQISDAKIPGVAGMNFSTVKPLPVEGETA